MTLDTLSYNDLAEISFKIGANWLLCQGNGGNTSQKNDISILIKASGYSLIESLERTEEVFVDVNMSTLQSSNNRRPSMELPFHIAIKNKYVFHYHSLYFLLLSINNLIKEATETLTDLSIKSSNIPYITPGDDLFNAISSDIQKCAPSDLYMLDNHGIIIAADTIDDCIKIIQNSEEVFLRILKNHGLDTQRLNSIFLSSELAALRLKDEITFKNDELKCIKDIYLKIFICFLTMLSIYLMQKS